ncbi:Attractin-like protein 1 [Mytilus edulis]|uniref:Attractin-like protein 1 n=1 Tax=Mytilus edulis TaxID=6550 RepID=A0A8S3QIM8_MYTED|nr:Attractin-like protein 1 [Mytilus edulis]
MHLERRQYFLICVCTFILILIIPDSSCTTHCDEINCREGECINDSCICDKGWKGPACQHCTGRVRLTDKEGIIFDGYGNYSEDNKCTWLIAPENNTQPIHLQLKQFSTECGWDHLYIYDGDSTFSPLLVAFSGLLRQKNEDDTVLPEITTTSGNAYIYFYSDAAYNMSGFNITYRTGGCEKDCLQNGQCINSKCNCSAGFTGDYCQTVICPNNCSDKGECEGNQCKCFSGYTGSDCSQKSYHGVWSTLDINTTIGGRASAAVAQVQDKLYLTGGYTFNNELPFLTRYDFNSDSWNTVLPRSTNNPESRYGHTLLEYQGKLYMFGGVVDKDTTKELWVYDLSSNDTWIVPRTFGSVVEGGFGHSSVYDPHSKLIYVYGGYHAGDTSSDQLSDKLYSFDISTRFWKTLPRNERPRYLHSAVLIGGLMLVFGGNTHNDTSISLGAKCYSLDFLAYDTGRQCMINSLDFLAYDTGRQCMINSLDFLAYDTGRQCMINSLDFLAYDTGRQCMINSLDFLAYDTGRQCMINSLDFLAYDTGRQCMINSLDFLAYDTGRQCMINSLDFLAYDTGRQCMINSLDFLAYDTGRQCMINSLDLAYDTGRQCMINSLDFLAYDTGRQCMINSLDFLAYDTGRQCMINSLDFLAYDTGRQCMINSLDFLAYDTGRQCMINSLDFLAYDTGRQCMINSLDFLAYDTECNKWLEVDVKGLPANGARYGHTAAVYKRNGKTQMYIIGGFNGMMQDNVMLFSPGDCNYTDPEFCTNSTQGSICVWTDSQTCISKDVLGTARTNRSCSSTPDHNESCKDVKDCRTCTSTCLSSHGDCTCQWCDSKCTYNCTLTQTKNCTTQTSNPLDSSVCSDHKHCPTCMSYGECDWSDKCSHIKEVDSLDYNTTRQVKKCDQPCIAHKSCENCTAKGCMWCGNKQLCVQTNSYVASFIYGQCMEWTTQQAKCPATRCSDLHTCDQCQANPKCGWCNDKTNTGLGKCMEGGLQGPVNNQSLIDLGSCDKNRWFFIGCPDCQCNGHSVCSNSTGKTEVCVECKNMTEGDNCEHCKEGFYGNPVNGGICKRCDCNEQADSCDRRTGVCNCRTRGVIGDKCDKCDESHKYFGDPKKGGTCFYHLVTDYQFTFNLSKKDDRFYTQINFMNIPQASDRDVDFKVNCSGESYLNISVRTRNNRVEKIYEAYPCTYFRTKFEHGDFSFGEKRKYNIPCLCIWISYSFLASGYVAALCVVIIDTFIGCFLSLLIIAAVLYKIKHKYDLYRRRQRMMVEMEEMASRPFASVTVEIDRKLDLAEKKETNSVDLRKRKKGGTKPVAIQPLSGHKAAILSLIVLLPTGGEEDLAPSGSSGVAIASALITMGHHRKQSLEHTKGEKTKYKKPFSSSHTDPV